MPRIPLDGRPPAVLSICRFLEGILTFRRRHETGTPLFPGLDAPHVCDARDLLMGKVEPAGSVVVLGDGYVGMETADFLIARGIGVTLVEMLPASPVGKHTAHGYWLHKRIKEAGRRIILGATVTRIEPDAVFYRQQEEEKQLPAAMVVTAMGAKPANDLEGSSRNSASPVEWSGTPRVRDDFWRRFTRGTVPAGKSKGEGS